MDDSKFYAIVSNKGKCTKCGDVIESKHRHDYVTCSCGSLSVDGGTDYLKRSGDIGGYMELSESRKFTEDEMLDYIKYISSNKYYTQQDKDKYLGDCRYLLELWYPKNDL